MKKGFIAMTTVLILSVVVVTIVTTVSLLSIGESQSAFALMKGEDALQFSEGCAEDALQRIRADESYAGGTFSRPEGMCVIGVSQEGNTWTITAYSDTADYMRNIQVVFERTVTGIVLTSWREM